MTKNITTQISKVVGKSLDAYHKRIKSTIDELKFKEEYQGRIIDCMVGEVDDNYIETPETDNSVVELEYSKEGIIKIPNIKGKTILVNSEDNETDISTKKYRLLSVGEEEKNKLKFLSSNKNLFNVDKFQINKESLYGYMYIGNYDNYTLSITDKDISIDISDIYFGLTKNGIDVSGGYEWLVAKGDILRAFITRNDFKYFSFYPNNQETLNKIISRFNVQIEKGDKVTSYVPNYSNKIEILLNEPLYAGNEIVKNKIIKYFDKIVLNSNKGVNRCELGDTSTHYRYNVNFNHLPNSPQVKLSGRILANSYNWHNYIDGSVNSLYLHNSTNGINLFIDKQISDGSIEWFSEYLEKNPLEIIFELAEPIIEELPNLITLQGFDDTTVYVENSIIPTVQYEYNIFIPYKQELLNQKEEVKINALDIENNIIPYLMNMEFNLMLMEDN